MYQALRAENFKFIVSLHSQEKKKKNDVTLAVIGAVITGKTLVGRVFVNIFL